MKLKLVTLLLTVGLFAFGTSVNAAEKIGAPKTTLTEEEKQKVTLTTQQKQALHGIIDNPTGYLICLALKAVPAADLPKICVTACAGEQAPKEMAQCASEIADASQKNEPWVKGVIIGVDSACTLGCTNGWSGWTPIGPAPCTVSIVRDLCGYVCCNIDKAHGDFTTGHCLTDYGKTCKDYTGS